MVLSAFEGISKVTGPRKRDGATSADKTPEVCLSDVTSEQRPNRSRKRRHIKPKEKYTPGREQH